MPHPTQTEPREIDTAIAEALGYRIEKQVGRWWRLVEPNGETHGWTFDDDLYPRYSTDSAASDELVEMLRERGWWLVLNMLRIDTPHYQTSIGKPTQSVKQYCGQGQTRAEAVAMAVYEAIQVAKAEGWEL